MYTQDQYYHEEASKIKEAGFHFNVHRYESGNYVFGFPYRYVCEIAKDGKIYATGFSHLNPETAVYNCILKGWLWRRLHLTYTR